MSFRRAAVLLFLVAVLTMGTSCGDEVVTEQTPCSTDSVRYQVFVVDQNNKPVDSLAITIRVFARDGTREYTPPPPANAPPGTYPLLDDSFLAIIDGSLTRVSFSGHRPRVAAFGDYWFLSDKCHISKVSGPDTIRTFVP